MVDTVTIDGRQLSAEVLAALRDDVRDPSLSRSELARRLCERSDWRSASGRLCEVGGRKALRELERRGMVTLPPPRRRFGPRCYRLPPESVREEIHADIRELRELRIVPVTGGTNALSRAWNDLLARYHPLGSGPLVGPQQRYLIRSERGDLGAFAFGAAARALTDRDTWVGWDQAARRINRGLVIGQTRFLIAPWVHIPNLASKVLAQVMLQVADDWERDYGIRPVLAETFVDLQNHTGSCYRAANWEEIGQTQGRGRQDRRHQRARSIKAIFVRPLCDGFRARLQHVPEGVARSHVHHAAPPVDGGPRDWADVEFGGARLGDARRTARLVQIARDFAARPQAHIPQACGDRAKWKATYRFLSGAHVTLAKILEPHFQATTERVRARNVVLAVQDTTTLNYAAHTQLEGCGPIATEADGAQGILLHETLALTPQGLSLGLIDAQVWARDPAEHGKSIDWYKRPIEQKESRKWLRSYDAAAALQRACPQSRVVCVGDREADLYELFARAHQQPDGPKLLVRAAAYPRKIDGTGDEVWPTIEATEAAGALSIRVPRQGQRKERQAHLEVRFQRIELRPPADRKRLGPVTVWAILAREVNAPEGASPIEWRLYTTVPVETFEDAIERLRWYTQRWQIEVFHRTLKTGCRIEQRRLATVTRLENCLAIDLVVAWRILHLTKLGRDTPDLPCTIVFEEHEWRALYAFARRGKPVPTAPPSIRDVIRLTATLGGFTGRKSDGEPGTQTLWLGLQRLDDIAEAYLVFHPRDGG